MTRVPNSGPGLKLRLVVDGGDWLGPGKADLLAGIAETGSISAAGKRMGMSYKRAWGLVEVLNAMFRAPLVSATRGGAGHGGAELTETGQTVLALYRAMQAKADAALAEEIAALAGLSVIPDRK
ncbi:MAG: hypothetical protein B7Z02_02075 [Rhodobacterales bacterium 32-67-9]|nr:MAG: hypothetical protein B7Z02_02075 [Rhodobacterales bacterium 32-67-9]